MRSSLTTWEHTIRDATTPSHRDKGRMEEPSCDARDPADLRRIGSRLRERSYHPEMPIARRSRVEPSLAARLQDSRNSGILGATTMGTSPSLSAVIKGRGGHYKTRFRCDRFDGLERGMATLSLSMIRSMAGERTERSRKMFLGL